jgi:hypothetical protein
MDVAPAVCKEKLPFDIRTKAGAAENIAFDL